MTGIEKKGLRQGGFKGAGLGLSIVKSIVDFYHGRIEVQSELGKGSVFTVHLPFRQSESSDDSVVAVQ